MGKGGSSKSVSNNYNTIDVNTETNINFDETVIADAIIQSTDKQIKAQKLFGNIQLEAQRNLASMQKAALSLKAAEIAAEERSKQNNLLFEAKKHKELVLLSLLISGAYIYKNIKKGK